MSFSAIDMQEAVRMKKIIRKKVEIQSEKFHFQIWRCIHQNIAQRERPTFMIITGLARTCSNDVIKSRANQQNLNAVMQYALVYHSKN